MTRRFAMLLLLPLLTLLPLPARASQGPGPLEQFIQQVARLWAEGDASGLTDHAPPDGQLLLNTGRGPESVNARHAAAALRQMFSDRETISLRPVRVTVAGGQPLRGFGELAWSYRTRGTRMSETRTLYLGAVWTGRSWRVSEIRVMP